MRLTCLVILPTIVLVICAVAQNEPPKPKLSKDLLTNEQVAVYRAVLKSYTKDFNGALNVSNRTELLDLGDQFFDKECAKGIALETTNSTVVHKLSPAVLIGPKMVLVDPEQQQIAINKNDPQNLMKKAIDEGEKITNKQLDKSVRQAFATGLFSLSEIVFDKPHRHAIVSYDLCMWRALRQRQHIDCRKNRR